MNKELEENLRVCLTLLKLVRGSVLNSEDMYEQHSEHHQHTEAIDF